jgi:hypothetical protein
MLDNPFSDTSKTHDTNLMFFNTLKAYYSMMNPTSDKLGGLIRSNEAQSYLRFIFRNIFSKINLIQLIAFINEKEAQLKQRMSRPDSMS